MEYDKNSFLSGLSVGITLKGWSGGNVGGTYGAAIVLQYGSLTSLPQVFSGYLLNMKSESLLYNHLGIGETTLTGED